MELKKASTCSKNWGKVTDDACPLEAAEAQKNGFVSNNATTRLTSSLGGFDPAEAMVPSDMQNRELHRQGLAGSAQVDIYKYISAVISHQNNNGQILPL